MVVGVKPFSCLVADPPWSFGDRLPGPGRGAEKHYRVLDLEAIKSFLTWNWSTADGPPISQDAWLFLWRVSSQVEEAYQVCRAWGFVPKSELVWLKRTATGKRWFGMGRSVRAEHETCIIAKRGKPAILDNSIRSTFEAKVPERGHSAKPDEFFGIVERLCAGPRLELFSRVHRPGWMCMGDQLIEEFGGDA